MPTENAKEEPIAEKEQKTVPIDTSGPGAEINVPEEKDESIVETQEKEPAVEVVEDKKDEPQTTEQEPVKEEKKEDDSKLEEYSRGVQSRIAKLTRKMREAERQRDSATEYAKAVEAQRQSDQKKYFKMDSDYQKRFETNIKTGITAAERELAAAIESGDAKAQVEANKRIATLAFENAKLQQMKEGAEEVKLSDGGKLPDKTPKDLPTREAQDARALDWASKMTWF